MRMLPGGIVKDFKVPGYSSAAGVFGYTSAKASDRTLPPLLFFFFFPRSTSHNINDADLTVKHLWQCICGSVGMGCLFLCSSAIILPRLG